MAWRFPTTTTPRPTAPASPACCRTSPPPAFACATSPPAKARSRKSSSASSRNTNEPPGDPHDLHLRDVADIPDAAAEHHRAGDHDLALFHRVRLGDRRAHPDGGRRALRL